MVAGVSRKTLHVIPVRREMTRIETWQVVLDESSTLGPVTRTNRPTDRRVRAERDPDQVCAEVAIAGETSVQSAVMAKRHAQDLAKVLACGSAVECPGISSCVAGAKCPYDLK